MFEEAFIITVILSWKKIGHKNISGFSHIEKRERERKRETRHERLNEREI